jgi:hypothetical protein
VLDEEKPRRSRSEELQEISDHLFKASADDSDLLSLRLPLRSLQADVLQEMVDEEVEREFGGLYESAQEREASERLLREEAEIAAERPLLHARQRKLQAAWRARARADNESERHVF